MGSRLFNVRLDEKRLRKTRKLRASGRNLADVVRDAIDTEYAAMASQREAVDAAAIVAAILEQYPDPPDLPSRDYDVHDAKAARKAVAKSIGRRQR